MGIVITPRTYPYAFWSHIKTFRDYQAFPGIPTIAGIPYSQDLVKIVDYTRGGRGNYSTAARTARLLINRWEPGLTGERQSRPGYEVLKAIRLEAVTRRLYSFTWWPATTSNLAYLAELGAYRLPLPAFVPSLYPDSADDNNEISRLINQADDYRDAGATLLFFQSLPTERGQVYELSAYAVWESSIQVDYSRLDYFET